jgi:8-oxo-dGTP pyrophosphatase MutT (NUDIX family)
MVREISSGGVVVRPRDGDWWLAVIEPPPDLQGSASPGKATAEKRIWALPKGLVDATEKPAETAVREVYEETGIRAQIVTKLADIKYVYTRTWADGERVFKVVSFYLMRYRSGRINEVSEAMRIEVARALWIKLRDAPRLLAYKGEKQMVRKAMEYLDAHPELRSSETTLA